MISRRGSPHIADYGGMQRVAPVLAGLFLIAGLATLSLPGLSTFVSEFLVLVGTFSRYQVAGDHRHGGHRAGRHLRAVAVPAHDDRARSAPEVESMPDLRPRELWASVPLVALIIAMGIYPKPVLDVINPAVHQTMVQIHMTDPKPRTRPPAASDQCAEGNHTVTGLTSSVGRQSVGFASHPACWRLDDQAPSIEYSQLAPMLVVFGAALAGVLVEAFAPRAARRGLHLVLTLGGLGAAFVLTIIIAATSSAFDKGSSGHVAAMGAVAVDRPTLFIQGTILVLALVSVLIIAEQLARAEPVRGRRRPWSRELGGA